MNKASHANEIEDLVKSLNKWRGQSVEEDQDIEASFSQDSILPEEEEGQQLPGQTEGSLLEEDQTRRPGAYAIPGDSASQSSTSSEATLSSGEDRVGLAEQFSDADEDSRTRPGAYAIPGDSASQSSQSLASSDQSSLEPGDVAAQPGVLWTAQSAELVDEAAEEERRQRYERESRRNRELENRIHEIESEAVIAIPVMMEDTDRPKSPTSIQAWLQAYVFQNRQTRLCFAGILFILAAAVVGTTLGIALADKSDQGTPIEPKQRAWNQLGQTLVGDEAYSQFGYSVALSANGTVLAGSGPLINGSALSPGVVRVVSYDTGSQLWKQLGQDMKGKEKGDKLGMSAALSWDGSVVAAGATTVPDRSGYLQVHTFKSDTGLWDQMGQDLEGVLAGDQFGSSIALSADGNVVAAGGPGRSMDDEDDYIGNQTGYVRVYAFESTLSLWTQMGQELTGIDSGDAFGRSVALSADGSVLAVGADWSHGNGRDSGRVQVFKYNNSTNSWNQIGRDLAGEEPFDYFGFSLDLSADGTIVAVGAVWNDGENGHKSGHVRIFSYDSVSSSWKQTGQDIDGESETNNFGHAVALSADGRIAASGANLNGGGGKHSGHIRIFSYNNNSDRWNKVGEDIDGEGEGDEFGSCVALSGDGTIVAAGSIYNDGNGPVSGHVRVFETPQ